MKPLIKLYSMFCIMIIACIFCTSCSSKNDYDSQKSKKNKVEQAQEQVKLQVDISEKDLYNNSESTTDMIADTAEADLSFNFSDHKDDNNTVFLRNFYDFTEQSLAHVFRDNKGENQIYAPLNLYLSLSMLSELSEGEAKEEIQEVLDISDAKVNASELNTAISALEKRRLPLGRLNVNTSLWLNDELNYQDNLLNTLQSHYRTEIYKGDLKSGDFINLMTKWVYENTNFEFQPDYHKSLDLIDPRAFISLNTLDFYNEWLYPFEEEDTRTETFFLGDNEEINCDFMKMEDSFHPFMVGEDYISTICVLKESESMLFILPDEGLLLDDFIEKRGNLSDIIYDWTNDQFSMGKVKLSVPKFAYEDEIDLKTTVERMGIKKIFDENSNAFTIFADENIYITDIWQASKIEINEKGCSASSYTEIRAMSSGVSKDEVEINLNRPFIYILYKDKVPFLVGIVGNPLG